VTPDPVDTPVAHPLRVGAHGATARTDQLGYLHDLIEQVLFTAPGERVNRPEFGAGIAQLVFAPVGPEVAATTQLQVHAALEQWLGNVIEVADVAVTSEESSLVVEISYVARISRQPGTVRFALQGSGA
jgi:uncharacterized protein